MMRILYNETFGHVEPAIPIRRGRGRGRGRVQGGGRGRGRPPILNKKPLVQAEPSFAIRRGRGRPPSLHKKISTQLEHGIRRGRGRPRKQEVSKPIIDLLPNHVFKKPRTKTKFVRGSWGANLSLPPKYVRCQALKLEDAKIQGSILDFGTSKSFADGEASPFTPPNCICYQSFSEIEIPGSVPDFDIGEIDGDLISKFFEDIPDVSSTGGWCKFCSK